MKLDKQVMISSFNNISHYPEKRGEQDFLYYQSTLEEDLKLLGDNKGNYEQKFIARVMMIYYRQARCASSFITGPANFPVNRNQKNWDSRDRAQADFDYWRSKYFKAVNRVRTLSPEEEIEKAVARLQFLENEKAKPKKYTHNIPSGEEDSYCSVYNVTLKIRETRQKIEVMKARIERKETFEPVKIDGGSIYIENDRFIVKHDEKPSREVIDVIKKHGFRYAPSFQCWCRKNTGNAAFAVKQLVKELSI